MTKMAAKWLKSIPNLWPIRLKNHTLWGRTYLYSPYKGVPPGGRISWTEIKYRKRVLHAIGFELLINNLNLASNFNFQNLRYICCGWPWLALIRWWMLTQYSNCKRKKTGMKKRTVEYLITHYNLLYNCVIEWNLDITRGEGMENMAAVTRSRCIEVLFHIFYYYRGQENRSS